MVVRFHSAYFMAKERIVAFFTNRPGVGQKLVDNLRDQLGVKCGVYCRTRGDTDWVVIRKKKFRCKYHTLAEICMWISGWIDGNTVIEPVDYESC